MFVRRYIGLFTLHADRSVHLCSLVRHEGRTERMRLYIASRNTYVSGGMVGLNPQLVPSKAASSGAILADFYLLRRCSERKGLSNRPGHESKRQRRGQQFGASMSQPFVHAQDDQASNASAPHTRPGCECRTVQPPVHTIRRVLESGDYPILGISTGDTDKLNLYVKRYDGTTPYVVFVPDEQQAVCSANYSTITTCQLMRIAMLLGKIYVQEIRSELCFWLAGLCSAPSIESEKVYSNAYRVLDIK